MELSGTFFIKEINSMLQRDMGLTPSIAMMDTLGLESSLRDSFMQGGTEFCSYSAEVWAGVLSSGYVL